MIGIALIADGLDFDISKGYIYFSMAFALIVEVINIMTGTRKTRNRGSIYRRLSFQILLLIES